MRHTLLYMLDSFDASNLTNKLSENPKAKVKVKHKTRIKTKNRILYDVDLFLNLN